MMQNTAYRLAEYKILQNKHGDLWWETHIGLGSMKTGKGFINGDILFIVPSDITVPGFLKGEFLDHLNRLPKWKKTKYYCASYKISECQSVSQKPLVEGTDSRLKLKVKLQRHESTQRAVAKKSLKSDNIGTTAHIAYKLGRYEITEMKNGQLVWKSPGGLGSLKKGPCHIKGNILFLEPGETEQSGLMRKEFLQQLNQLPNWVATKYFCVRYAIYYSSTGARCRTLEEEKDDNITIAENTPASNKKFGVGKIAMPSIVNENSAKGNLTTLFKQFQISAVLILRRLFKST